MPADFKSHDAAPTRSGVTPLGSGPKQQAERKGRAGAKPASTKTKSGQAVTEIGGPKGPEPTRYGDWERNGICYDF